jgi:Protein of unknown function (DUF4446)
MTIAFAESTLSFLVLLAMALALLALLPHLAGVMRGRLRAGRTLPRGRRVTLEVHAKSIERLEAAVRQLALGERTLGELAEASVRHVSVVRFDAFEDMGGRLSFSAALLDGHGDGLVITSINGRQESRCYSKQVRGGSSVHNLTDEERQAIKEALEGGGSRLVTEASR